MASDPAAGIDLVGVRSDGMGRSPGQAGAPQAPALTRRQPILDPVAQAELGEQVECAAQEVCGL
jgi:hypothetical protein